MKIQAVAILPFAAIYCVIVMDLIYYTLLKTYVQQMKNRNWRFFESLRVQVTCTLDSDLGSETSLKLF